MSGIGQIDKNLMVSGTVQKEDLVYRNVRSRPFAVYGLLPDCEGAPFCRIPRDLAEKINPGVLRLYARTAGGRVRFQTDSSCVAIRAKMPQKCLMPHMPFLGSSGFDLYATEKGNSVYKGSFVPPIDRDDCFESLINFGSRKIRNVTIHFPLYDEVDALCVGVEHGAVLESGEQYRQMKPILYYGSSITQGGCASRPGNCYTNIISRNLNIDHVNLGFSGSSKGEKLMAEYISKQPMSLFVYDYDHNAPSVEHLNDTHERFFLTIREKNPDLPVILASRTDTPKTARIAEETTRRRNVIMKTYENALKRGDKQICFIDGSTIFDECAKLGAAADSCTVDGVHPNDLGFACMAHVFGSRIREYLL